MSNSAESAGSAGTATTGGVHPIPRPEPAAHEAYAFACMSCGHGWEQAYEIAHQVDPTGEMHVVYYADGHRVPSPLTRPTCLNCGGNVVRIMRAGQVSKVSHAMESMYQQRPNGGYSLTHTERPAGAPAQGEAESEAATGSSAPGPGDGAVRHHWRHWHLSDLLHPFQHHR
jgi:hypothetical protein